MKIVLSCGTMTELKSEIEKLRKLYPMARFKEPKEKSGKYYKCYVSMV